MLLYSEGHNFLAYGDNRGCTTQHNTREASNFSSSSRPCEKGVSGGCAGIGSRDLLLRGRAQSIHDLVVALSLYSKARCISCSDNVLLPREFVDL